MVCETCPGVLSAPDPQTNENVHRVWDGGGWLNETVVLQNPSWDFVSVEHANQRFRSRGRGVDVDCWQKLLFRDGRPGVMRERTHKPTVVITGPRSWGILRPFMGRPSGRRQRLSWWRRGARAAGSGWALRRGLRAISLGVRSTACFKRVLGWQEMCSNLRICVV